MSEHICSSSITTLYIDEKTPLPEVGMYVENNGASARVISVDAETRKIDVLMSYSFSNEDIFNTLKAETGYLLDEVAQMLYLWENYDKADIKLWNSIPESEREMFFYRARKVVFMFLKSGLSIVGSSGIKLDSLCGE